MSSLLNYKQQLHNSEGVEWYYELFNLIKYYNGVVDTKLLISGELEVIIDSTKTSIDAIFPAIYSIIDYRIYGDIAMQEQNRKYGGF